MNTNYPTRPWYYIGDDRWAHATEGYYTPEPEIEEGYEGSWWAFNPKSNTSESGFTTWQKAADYATREFSQRFDPVAK